MSESRSPNQVYLGEPKPRDPSTALLLTLICPGLGAVYLGHLLQGVLICMLYVAAAGGFILAWTAGKFFPLAPAIVLVVAGVAITLHLGLRAAEEARRSGQRYILKSCNHPVVYIVVAVFCFLVPLAGLGQFTSQRLWALVWVQTEAMYPTLVEGDLLLVDRTAYRNSGPRAGDIVVVRSHGAPHAGLRLGRIIGLPGDQVSVQDATPIINGRPLTRQLVSLSGPDAEVQLAALDDVTRPVGAVTVAERNDGAYYLTAEQPAEWGMMLEPVELADTEYYVVHDNRSHFGDSRDFGPVPRVDIVGQPLYVAYSVSDEDGVRWNRLARRAQPEPTKP